MYICMKSEQSACVYCSVDDRYINVVNCIISLCDVSKDKLILCIQQDYCNVNSIRQLYDYINKRSNALDEQCSIMVTTRK